MVRLLEIWAWTVTLDEPMNKFILIRLNKSWLFSLTLALLGRRWWYKGWSCLRWSLCRNLHSTLSLLGASSIFWNRLFLLNFLLRTFGLPKVSFSDFYCICLLFELFVKNGFDSPFCSYFLSRIVLMVLKSLMKSLVVSPRLDIV